MDRQYVIGVDFGSDSARAIVVDACSAEVLAEASMLYPRWEKRKYCDSECSQYRQHPKDYLEVLEGVLKEVLDQVGSSGREKIAGIAVDTTGSTVCPVDEEGTPLAMLDAFLEEPDAMFHMWKDHTAVKEARELNEHFSKGGTDYTQFQGEYSAEWFWAKILHTVRKNPAVRAAAYTWVEHTDWIAGVLAGRTRPEEIVHCACAAGHKALWNSRFVGLPARDCLSGADPYLGLIHDRYSQQPKNAGERIGTLSPKWASKLGLSEQVSVAVGSFDAHAGAVGVGISERTLVKVAGTSTVDMMIMKPEDIKGKNISVCCGMAENSIVPGFYGCEAGQSAFGDTYVWYKRILMWPLEHMYIPEEILPAQMRTGLQEYMAARMICELEKAAQEEGGDEKLTALDWFNGRRYPCLNETVKSSISGLSLGTAAPDIYRALVKGTIFGSRHIYDSLVEAGAQIDRVICVGGVAQKSRYIMQMLSDVLDVPIMVSKEKQSCARGACVFAAVGAGLFPDVQAAQRALCETYEPTFYPRKDMHEKYQEEYAEYLELGEYTEGRRG